MKRPLRILVTGGAGMIGSHVAEHFASGGHRVVALDNLLRLQLLGYRVRRQRLSWDRLRGRRNVRRLVGDVRNAADLRRALLKGADLVVHAAGQVGIQQSLQNPCLDSQINILGTLRLLEGMRRWAPAATLIFCSTNKVYGSSINSIPLVEGPTRYRWRSVRGIPESWPTDRSAHTPYGVSKLAADLYVQEYARTFGIRAAVFRMSCIYGTYQFGMADQGWVAWLALAILKGWPVALYGTGKQVRDLLYVTDLSRLCELYHRSSLGSEVFNVGGGPRNTASVLEVLGRLQELLGRKASVQVAPERLHDQRVYISDIGRTGELLRWHPRVAVPEGLRLLTGWLKANSRFFR